MVLVDTSVWIRFLAAKEPFASELDHLLAKDQVLGHDLIYGELLIGQRGGRTKFLTAYSEIHRAPSVSHVEVVELVTSRKLAGRGIGWVDAHLLASTLIEKSALFTADAALAAIAASVGVAYDAAV